MQQRKWSLKAAMLLLIWTGTAHAQTEPAATLRALSGTLEVQRAGTAEAVPLAERGPLFAGDLASTGAQQGVAAV